MRRRGIFTKPPRQVNLRRAWLGLLVCALAAGLAEAQLAQEVRSAAPRRVRVVFLLAQFPDLPLASPREHFTAPVGRTGLVERLVDYYAQVSAGRLLIETTVADVVVTMPQRQAGYVQAPERIIRDALATFLATGGDDVTRAALETADAVVVFFAGPGKESDLHGTANDPWSNFTMVVPAATTPGGHRIRKGCVIAAEQREGLSSFGVLCHEFGHLLGLPELYAPGGAAHEGIGVWGLMGQGTWLGRGNSPPYPSAWSRVVMGWADVAIVTRDGEVSLPAVDTSPRVIKLSARRDGEGPEYFLIENRQRRGIDRSLPGSGLLIWHIDESVTGYRTSQSDPDHMRVTLIQADGRDDLRVGHRAGGNRGDAGDPWRGLDRLPRLLLDLALVLGVVLPLAVAGTSWRRRRLDWLSMMALAVGLASLGIALGMERSPVCRPGAAPGSGTGAVEAGTFTISHISAVGDPMRFRVTFDPPRNP